MSYNQYDIIRDSDISLGGDQHEIDLLLSRLNQYTKKRCSEFLWELVDEWQQDHEFDNAPDYAIGVERGLMMAARKLGEE